MSTFDLAAVLLPALRPCRHFDGICKSRCNWCPKKGHIPRGFLGGTNGARYVQLILVTAEPGDPATGEEYSGGPEEMLIKHMDLYKDYIEHNSLRRGKRAAPFHRNLRRFIDMCWPETSLEIQLEKTWITDAVLCSAVKSGGRIAREVEATCVESYFKKQRELMPNAYVIALGRKAKDRLLRCGIALHDCAYHPSARVPRSRDKNWYEVSDRFRRWVGAGAHQ
jgi:hypothetical protein